MSTVHDIAFEKQKAKIAYLISQNEFKRAEKEIILFTGYGYTPNYVQVWATANMELLNELGASQL